MHTSNPVIYFEIPAVVTLISNPAFGINHKHSLPGTRV